MPDKRLGLDEDRTAVAKLAHRRERHAAFIIGDHGDHDRTAMRRMTGASLLETELDG